MINCSITVLRYSLKICIFIKREKSVLFFMIDIITVIIIINIVIIIVFIIVVVVKFYFYFVKFNYGL